MSPASDERLAAALRAEYAAIFGFGPIGAHLDGAARTVAAEAEVAHRARRDALILRLSSAAGASGVAATGGTAPAAEPGYRLPFAVTDRASALKLALTLEERAAAVWRAALPETTGDDRALALDSLTDLAIRAVRIRRISGVVPAVVTLPGAPVE